MDVKFGDARSLAADLRGVETGQLGIRICPADILIPGGCSSYAAIYFSTTLSLAYLSNVFLIVNFSTHANMRQVL
jgi:hypothetical protein